MKRIENESKLKELYKLSDIDLLRYFKKNPESIAFYPLAKRLLTKKKYKEAVQIVINGIKIHSEYIEPRILLAKIYIKANSLVEAVQTLKETIKLAPECAQSYYYLSEVLFKKGIDERAEILLTKAYELAPNSPDIKNAFEKRFKNSSNTTTASYNIETTVIESIDDIKKRAMKELGLENEKNELKEIDKIEYNKDSIISELEKEFSYKKRQTLFGLFGIFLILAVIIFLIASILFRSLS